MQLTSLCKQTICGKNIEVHRTDGTIALLLAIAPVLLAIAHYLVLGGSVSAGGQWPLATRLLCPLSVGVNLHLPEGASASLPRALSGQWSSVVSRWSRRR